MSMRQLKITKSITSRESQSLEKYLQEIGKVELLQPEEEPKLAARIKQGDQAALERLTKANLRFVVSVAKQYQRQGLALCDLINEGNIGLIKAAQRFDETRGFRFISYAVWWIRQSILQALAEQSRVVRMPVNKVGLTSKIAQAYHALEQEYEREPTTDELATMLEISSEEVVTTMLMSSRHLSVDCPVYDEEDTTMLDMLANGNAAYADAKLVHEESLKTELDNTLRTLTSRQKEVICSFYGIGVDHPLSLKDIGSQYRLTRERVRQIRDAAILHLRTNNISKGLRVYLGQ